MFRVESDQPFSAMAESLQLWLSSACPGFVQSTLLNSDDGSVQLQVAGRCVSVLPIEESGFFVSVEDSRNSAAAGSHDSLIEDVVECTAEQAMEGRFKDVRGGHSLHLTASSQLACLRAGLLSFMYDRWKRKTSGYAKVVDSPLFFT